MGIRQLRVPGIAVLAIAAWVTASPAQTGGPFNLNRNVIAAGGATFATGGVFKLGGTTAQADAGLSSGGSFTLQSGFWAGFISGVVAVDPGPVEFPHDFQLLRAAPNPFTATTLLAFELPRESGVHLAVYDLAGHRIRTLVDQRLAPGTHRVSWDGRDDHQGAMPAGVYFASFEAGSYHAATRIVLLH